MYKNKDLYTIIELYSPDPNETAKITLSLDLNKNKYYGNAIIHFHRIFYKLNLFVSETFNKFIKVSLK